METMTDQGTENRVDELSKRVDFGFQQTNERLGRVETDVRELRTDMNARFDKVNAGFDKVNAGFGKVDDEFKSVRGEMQAGFARVDAEFTALRGEMKAGFDAMQKQMTRFFTGALGTVIAGVIVTVVTVLVHS